MRVIFVISLVSFMFVTWQTNPVHCRQHKTPQVVDLGYSGAKVETVMKTSDVVYAKPMCHGGRCPPPPPTKTCSKPSSLKAVSRAGHAGYFGTIGSGKYKNNENCWWSIQAPADQRLRLHFESLYLEYGNRYCPYDYVNIHNGKNENGQRLGKYCGIKAPDDIITTGNSAYVRFSTDSSVTKYGFRLRYSIVSCNSLHTIFGSHGEFGTVGPAYGNFEECSWKIEVPNGKRVRLHFKRFHLENNNKYCPYDKLKIYDGSSASASLKGTLCGKRRPKDIESTGKTMFVTFSSDISLTFPGFRIQYSVPASCSVVNELTGPSGTFGTTGSQYENNEVCSWKIEVAQNKRVLLHIYRFNIEVEANCEYDSLTVYKGPNDSAPMLGKYCGETIPTFMVSSGNTMFIKFQTDGSARKPGFWIGYTTG
uniref:Exoskeleton protein RP43 n=1 Tax=Riftia pachyptila TaxID=6426 RepID=RP43_RIFPA|nr:RecName: Full=Exoskeleton protein RP43; Flags: Precursor [Riftia pachyptila]AAF37867.1 exoskeleton protein RP43 [Riftia pachyptila]